MKYLKTPQELNEASENLNISDVRNSKLKKGDNVYDREITLEELSVEIDKEKDAMSEQEKYCRLRDCDPTFLMFAYSSMIHEKMDKAIINEHTYKIEKVSTD